MINRVCLIELALNELSLNKESYNLLNGGSHYYCISRLRFHHQPHRPHRRRHQPHHRRWSKKKSGRMSSHVHQHHSFYK